MGPRKKKEANAAGSQAPEAAALQVSISSTFFVRTSFRQLFLGMFWLWQNIRTKNVRKKTLMELTAGINIITV
jgi:hypothetical protein